MKLSSSILLLLGLLLAAAASASLLEVRSTVRNAGDDDSDSDEDDGKVEFTVPAVDKDPEALDPKDMRDDPEPLLTMSKESSVACKNAGITADVGLLFGKDPLDKTQCLCGVELDPNHPLAKHGMKIPPAKGVAGDLKSFGEGAKLVDCPECRVDVSCNDPAYVLSKEGDKYWCKNAATCEGDSHPFKESCECKFEVKPLPPKDFKPEDPLRGDTPELVFENGQLFYRWKRANVELKCLEGFEKRKGQGVDYCVKPIECPPIVEIPSPGCGPVTKPFFKLFMDDVLKTNKAMDDCFGDVKAPGQAHQENLVPKRRSGMPSRKKHDPLSLDKKDGLGDYKKKDKTYDQFRKWSERYGIDHRDIEKQDDIRNVEAAYENYGIQFKLTGRHNSKAAKSDNVLKNKLMGKLKSIRSAMANKKVALGQCIMKCKFLHYRASENYFMGYQKDLSGKVSSCLPVDDKEEIKEVQTATSQQLSCLSRFRDGVKLDVGKRAGWDSPGANKPFYCADKKGKPQPPTIKRIAVEADASMNSVDKRSTLCSANYNLGGVISLTDAQSAVDEICKAAGVECTITTSETDDTPAADCMKKLESSKVSQNEKESKCMGGVSCWAYCKGHFKPGGVGTCINSCYDKIFTGEGAFAAKGSKKRTAVQKCMSETKRMNGGSGKTSKKKKKLLRRLL